MRNIAKLGGTIFGNKQDPASRGGYVPINSSAKQNSVKRGNITHTYKTQLESLFWTD